MPRNLLGDACAAISVPRVDPGTVTPTDARAIASESIRGDISRFVSPKGLP